MLDLQNEKPSSSSTLRASTTDAEARVMKMGDGGFRPAYNVQYAVAGSEMGGPRTIVGVTVTNVGSDMGSLAPMMEQVKERTGQRPMVLLADGGYAKSEDIATTRRMGIKVIVPASESARTIEKLKTDGVDPEVIAWREDMETEEAKRLYRARAGISEITNAHQKTHHGIGQFFFINDGKAVRHFQHMRIAEWPPEGGFSSVCDAVSETEHLELQSLSVQLLQVIGWSGVAMVEYRSIRQHARPT